MWYFGPRNKTSADHRLQIEKPMCSEKIEKIRLRLATREPPLAQNVGSSGDQSSIHRPLRECVPGGGASGSRRGGARGSTAVLTAGLLAFVGCGDRASGMFLDR